LVNKIPKASLLTVLVVIAVFSLPLVYLAVMTFTSPTGCYDGRFQLSLANLSLLWDSEFLRSLGVSIVAAALGAVLSLCLVLTAAYGFYLFYSPAGAALPLAGRMVLGSFLALMVFNGGIVPHYLLVRYLGMINSLAALFVPYLLNPLMVLFCTEQFRKIPPALLEAGRLEGAWSP
jgi:putative aldouronate transport system permease protein